MHTTPASGRSARSQALAAARAWLDTPPPEPGIGPATFRHIAAGHSAMEALVDELDRVAAAERPVCDGTARFVHSSLVDVDGIGVCPVCLRDVPTRPTSGPLQRSWAVVAAHRVRTVAAER